jgi:hypothetical protein
MFDMLSTNNKLYTCFAHFALQVSFHISTNPLLARKVRRNQHNLAIIDIFQDGKIEEERTTEQFVDKVYLH